MNSIKKLGSEAITNLLLVALVTIIVICIIAAIVVPMLKKGDNVNNEIVGGLCTKTGMKVSEYTSQLDSYKNSNNQDFGPDDVAVIKQTCEDLQFCSASAYSPYKSFCDKVAPVGKSGKNA